MNAITGAIVGAFYAAACVLVFGGSLRFNLGTAVFVAGVWAGVSWAVASGLAEVFPVPRSSA